MRIASTPWMLSLASLLAFLMPLFIVGDLIEKEGVREGRIMKEMQISVSKANTINISRKLLQSSGVNDTKLMGGKECSKNDIVINQAQVSHLPNGIPSYRVEIMNVCSWPDCSISNIHVECGWFSSARLVNPKLFQRLGYNDCLVNGGYAILPGRVVSFEYANTYSYHLSISRLVCHHFL